MAELTTSDVVDQLMDHVAECLTLDGARRLAGLRAAPEVQARIDDLADRCTEGRISPEERSEYETYVSYIDFIGVLQAKARRLLASEKPTNGSGH